jgi:quinohemoprotein ethanol dehydrogenase
MDMASTTQPARGSRTWLYLLITVALIAAAAFAWRHLTGGGHVNDTSVGTEADWTNTGGGYDEAGYSKLEELTPGNAGRLGLVSSLDLEGESTLEATPVAVNGVLYFTGTYAKVYAVEATTGKLLWTFDPKTWEHNPAKMLYSFSVNRGVAYAGGRIFFASLDGRLFALDAKTGQQIWVVETVPSDIPYTVTGAPRVFKDKVIIGNGGAEIGVRGFVTAFDQATGKQAWKFYTVPGAPEQNKGDPVMERAAATWTGEFWKAGGGGTVWNGMTFDAEMNRIYLGVGNGGPWDPQLRSPGKGGDNLYISSILALDADTGKYLWHYQESPNEEWDYKATPNIVMATVQVDGKPRKVLLHTPTNGFFYMLDRENGKLMSAEKIGKVTWASHVDMKTGRPVEIPGARYDGGESIAYPGGIGGHNWQAMSYSGKSGLVYIPYMQIGARYLRNKPVPGMVQVSGVTFIPYVDPKDPADAKGQLIAWDPVAQKPRWKVQHDTLWNGGTLATAGGLVFQGTADGWFTAYNAESGEQVWRFNVGQGIVAAPISYAVGGKQYVSILAGYGGVTGSFGKYMNTGWKYGSPRRILTFALDGKAKLSSDSKPDMKVHALDDPKLVINEADVEAGHALYSVCGGCHGQNLYASGAPGPDLKESAIALDPELMYTIVHEGKLLERGMPKIDFYTKEQVRQIYMYIRAGARESLGLRKPMAEKASAAKM